MLWGSFGNGNREFNRPIGIAADNINKYIYVADTKNNRIQKFNMKGEFQGKWESWENDNGKQDTFNSPYGLAVDSKGFVYVADRVNDRILKFNSDGRLVRWGNEDIEKEGLFNRPCDVAIDEKDSIYVADTKNNLIWNFNPDGSLKQKWERFQEPFSDPSGIAVHNGSIYVADTSKHRIQQLDAEGNFNMWGDSGSDDGKFDTPTGVTVDGSGFVYVADTDNHRIQKFGPDGQFKTKFAQSGPHFGQLNWPNYLCIDSYSNVYVADTKNNRIQVFKPVDPEEGISKAVIIAGGGPYEGNHLWDATRMNANFAYRTLNYQGFAKNDICYLSSDTQLDLDGDNEADVHGKATVENLRQAVSDISDSSENVKDLLVYLVDHGGDGYFRMNEDAEMLYAYALNSELEKLQQKISGTMIIVYDACKSGSFINSPLNPSDTEKRIIITSSLADQDAYFITQGSLSFSNLFWTHIFNGAFVQDAFNSVKAFYKKSITNQMPRMKDNTDKKEYIGNGTDNSWEGPEITESSYKNQFLQATVEDKDGVARVWAVIIPPQDSAFDSASKAVLELPSVDLMPVADSQYKAEYKGLNTDQPYNIMIHAIDRIGNKAAPQSVTISSNNLSTDKAIILAGSFESDTEHKDIVKGNAEYAYTTLKYQGYTEIKRIGLDNSLKREDLKSAIEEYTSPDTNDVVIYLTGQGGYREFQINDKETLTAADFGEQLDDLQSKISGMVILIYDADYSGSLLSLVKPQAGKKRILISSTSASQKAYFSEGTISFSFFFWNNVLQGMTVREAFINAKKSVRLLAEKIPQMDDDGNGIGNENTDGELAENTTIGAGIRVTMNDPFVKEVSSPDDILTGGETSATIKADISVTDKKEDDKVEVWATVISPGYDADWLPVQRDEPQTIDLKLINQGQYEAAYDGFSKFGK